MTKINYLFVFAVAALLCGCGKQNKINAQKIDVLSQKVAALQQDEARQLAAIQSELTALAPMLEQTNSYYFAKSYEDAFFFHTNTLYLLLTVDRKIESELQEADLKREAESSLAFLYHTNQLGALALSTAQIQDALAGQEGRLETNITVQTRQLLAALGDDLENQIKAAAPDAAETARQAQLAADVAQMKLDLDLIMARLKITNSPAVGP